MNAQKLIDNFSTHLKNVIARAMSLSAYLKHNKVDPVHLLIAITEEQGCVAAEILKNCNMDNSKLKKAMTEVKPKTPKEKNEKSWMLPDLNNESRAALEKALTMAYERTHNYIGTEHLLYGIINTKNKIIEKILKECKIDYQKLFNYVENSLNNTSRFSSMEDVANMFEDMNHMRDAGNINQANPQQAAPIPMPRQHNRQQASILPFFTTDLTDKREQKHIDPVVGRENEINRIINILARRTKNNPILVGEPGVGKTAIIEGLAKKINKGNVPGLLKRKSILLLDLTMLVAGTIYRGEFEARLKQIVEEVSKNDKYILFIDELHNIIGAGSNQGTMDAANILKPALARGKLRCIGATTHEEYKRYIASDPALERRFQPIHIEEPSIEETMEILKGLKKYYEAFHKVNITKSAIESAEDLSSRYIHEQFQPDKSIDLVDEAAAAVKARKKQSVYEKKHDRMIDRLEEAAQQKEQAIKEERLEDGLKWKNATKTIMNQMAVLEKSKSKKKGICPRVTEKDIAQVVSTKLNIDEKIILKSEWEKLETLGPRLEKHIIGQDKAIQHVIDGLKLGHLRSKKESRPLASFLFVGPSGVGKTELAKKLAQELYYDRKSLIRLDMSEFAEAHSVSKILGSPAGYVGYKERNMIADEIRRRPYSIILFDEIDKAHQDVTRLLMQILDEGALTDSSGKKVYFKHSIVILTTNLGSELFKSSGIGFGGSAKTKKDEIEKTVKNKLKEELGDALISRINTITLLHPLKKEHIQTIIKNHIEEINKYLRESEELSVSADEKAINKMIKELYTQDLGARNLEREVQNIIHNLVISVLKKKQPKEKYKLTAQKQGYVLT